MSQKGNILIIVLLIIVVLVTGAYFFLTRGETTTGGDSLPVPGSRGIMDSRELVGEGGGTYETYEPAKLAQAAGSIVLFFNLEGEECLTCRALDADIEAYRDKIPADLTILDVNYDDSDELKQKYGVTYQHTLVQVDATGNLIKKWSGSQTLAALAAEVE